MSDFIALKDGYIVTAQVVQTDNCIIAMHDGVEILSCKTFLDMLCSLREQGYTPIRRCA